MPCTLKAGKCELWRLAAALTYTGRQKMIDDATIAKAVELLVEAAPGGKVILLGSYARGDADEGSDVDFLVIEPEVRDQFQEMLRLKEVLRPLRIAVDVLVASQQHFEYWADTPGTVYYEALAEGKVLEALPRIR
jgi:predicted nucleotidyltransferase